MSKITWTHKLTRLSKDRVSYKVSLSERAQNACGQEGRGNVCWWLFDVGPKYIHNSGKRRDMNEWVCVLLITDSSECLMWQMKSKTVSKDLCLTY